MQTIKRLAEEVAEINEYYDLVAPEGYVYKHKYLVDYPLLEMVKFRTRVFINAVEATEEMTKKIFGKNSTHPHVETEGDYELVKVEIDDSNSEDD